MGLRGLYGEAQRCDSMNKIPNPTRIFIAASGSGGHLFPAVYIAEELSALLSSHSPTIEFIGSGSRLEPTIIDARGYVRHVIPVGKIAGVSWVTRAKTLLGLVRASIETWGLIRRWKPHLVVGVGGYASFLPVTIARICGIPTWIHEAERMPGIANRILAWYSSGASVALPNSKLAGRYIVFTGHPVRPELATITPRTEQQGPPRRVLVLGGSQGSRAVDIALATLAPFFAKHKVELWHQARPENVDEVGAKYRAAGIEHRVVSFIEDMKSAYSWADIVVSRAGAGSVNELGIANRPTILIPLATKSGSHQRDNAILLVNAGKAVIVDEGPNLLPDLQRALERYLAPEEYYRVLAYPAENRSLQSAKRIAEECVKILAEE